MNNLLRTLFFHVIGGPAMRLLLGLRVRHRNLLPRRGPAIIVANHNSHLDTLAIISLLPGRLLPRIRPVAAADYFLRSRLWAWFSRAVLGILPLARGGRAAAADMAECSRALERGDILILFPEGGRGQPEKRLPLKPGIARLATAHPDVPVVPLFLKGLGRVLPKGEIVPVPFECDAVVGPPLRGFVDRSAFMERLETSFRGLEIDAGADR